MNCVVEWSTVIFIWGLAAGVWLWAGGVDMAAMGWLQAHYDEGFNAAMRVLGYLGKGATQAAACMLVGAVLWWKGRHKLARIWLLCVPVFLLAGMVNLLLKFAIGRPRPKEVLWNGASPYEVQPFMLDAGFWSFPSGHAVSTFAIATVLMVAFPRWRGMVMGIAAALASSRFLALTPHYVGDVVAGAAVGMAVGLLGVQWAKSRDYV